MLFSVEQAFVGREEIRAPLKTPAWEAKLEGTDVDSPELVFNRLLHPLSVSVGQKFQIWYGEDLTDCEGNNNMGMTCADIYGWYV